MTWRRVLGNPRSVSAQDLDDAFETLREGYDLDLSLRDVKVSAPRMVSLDELSTYDDFSSWVDFSPGELVEEPENLGGFRGSAWARHAKQWQSPQELPPVVVADLPQVTAIADGRGRINYATGMGWKAIPAVFMTERA